MDKKAYARMILADREVSTSFWHALRRSIGRNNGFPVVVLVSILIGAFWIYTDMFPITGGLLIGVACGGSAFWIKQISAYVRQRAWVDEFVDWEKVQEAADRP